MYVCDERVNLSAGVLEANTLQGSVLQNSATCTGTDNANYTGSSSTILEHLSRRITMNCLHYH